MELELYCPFCDTVGSRGVPAHALTEEIIRDYVQKDLPGLSQVIKLNQRECCSKGGGLRVRATHGRMLGGFAIESLELPPG